MVDIVPVGAGVAAAGVDVGAGWTAGGGVGALVVFVAVCASNALELSEMRPRVQATIGVSFMGSFISPGRLRAPDMPTCYKDVTKGMARTSNAKAGQFRANLK
jgi:hypothetical protein